MEEKQKEVIAMTVMAVSFVLLFAFLPILGSMEVVSVGISSAVLVVLIIVFVCSLIASIEYSESGWKIEGSTTEWIVAAFFAPWITLFLYIISKDQEEGEITDPDDQERLGRI